MNKKKIEKSIKTILDAIGADTERGEIKNTPKRVAEMYEEILSGTKRDPRKEL